MEAASRREGRGSAGRPASSGCGAPCLQGRGGGGQQGPRPWLPMHTGHRPSSTYDLYAGGAMGVTPGAGR